MNISQQTLGYILIALSIIIAITGWISYQRGGRMKVITYVVFVIVTLALGIKFAFTSPEKTMEVKEVVLPQNPGRR